ncbi:MAG: hypothetical protein NC918_04565, partial [Candidatus Omnitrophica bacterium]|nr:hypothetical protein [Candidatus Omnitrophota bacterium]
MAQQNAKGFQMLGIERAVQKGLIAQNQQNILQNIILDRIEKIRNYQTSVSQNQANIFRLQNETLKPHCEGCSGGRGCCGSFNKEDIKSYISASNKAPQLFFSEDKNNLELRKELIEKEKKKLQESYQKKIAEMENKAIEILFLASKKEEKQNYQIDNNIYKQNLDLEQKPQQQIKLVEEKQKDYSFNFPLKDYGLNQINKKEENKAGEIRLKQGQYNTKTREQLNQKSNQIKIIYYIKELNKIVQKNQINNEDKNKFQKITFQLLNISKKLPRNIAQVIKKKIENYREKIQNKLKQNAKKEINQPKEKQNGIQKNEKQIKEKLKN